jgi:hypothetical protein
MPDSWVQYVIAPVMLLIVGWALDHRNAKRTKPLSEQVGAVHHATTVNHHSSAEPTILDRLSDISKAQDRAEKRAETRFARIEGAIGLPPAPEDVSSPL